MHEFKAPHLLDFVEVRSLLKVINQCNVVGEATRILLHQTSTEKELHFVSLDKNSGTRTHKGRSFGGIILIGEVEDDLIVFHWVLCTCSNRPKIPTREE
jgi:hypothetical protein